MSTIPSELSRQVIKGDAKALARAISYIENEIDGYEELLKSLPAGGSKIIGITGPPGAGKSTLTDGLIGFLVKGGKKLAVLCIDPSSPFHLGAVLGDRIRMSEWYTNENVFIRSLAARGSMGGLHPRIIEIAPPLPPPPPPKQRSGVPLSFESPPLPPLACKTKLPV